MKKLKKLRKEIRKVQKETEWSRLRIIKRLMRAYTYGIKPRDYFKNNCYKMKRKELKRLGERLQKRDLAIKETMKNGKLSRKDATRLVKEAHKLGFTYTRYISNRVWEFNFDELEEAIDVLNDIRRLNNFNYNYYVNIAAEKAGWSIEKTKDEMAKARGKGYYARSYIMNNLYLLKYEEIEDRKNEKPSKEDLIKKKEKQKEREEHIKKIRDEKGWTFGRYRIEYNKARFNCGCDEEEFYLYKLYNKSKKEQKEYITTNTYWKMKMRYCDFKENYIYFHDKALFNENFKKFIHRKWFTTDDLTYEKFKENIKGLSCIAYKPIDQLQGIGFRKFNVNESEHEDSKVYKYIKSNGRGIVEEFITQHHDTAIFSPKSCNSLRIVTMYLNNKFKILGAVFRTGIDNDFDNWSAGGIIAGVDVKTGKIDTDGADKKGNKFVCHPVSKVKYKGYQIPCWKKIEKELKEASKVIPNMPYIGWDVAITDKDEIEFIEGNHNHDIKILQSVYGILEDRGVKSILKSYMNEEMELNDESEEKSRKN
ncbi:MAG: sugar-transfer associated ATP-grasp domain-containing protein [bacterium]|nr:sugar-transfer associated ATP-grasp domain-containing protein [bacterium]